MRVFTRILFLILLLCTFVVHAQENEAQIEKKVGFGFKFGSGAILGDKLSRTNQSVGPTSSFEVHFNLQETVEVISEFSYGYNDVDFTLGNAHVQRIFQRAFTVGFRFYLPQVRIGSFLPTLSFGTGFYEWFYTNSDKLINFSGEGIQTYKGEDLSIHSLGLNAGLGLRIKLSRNLALDSIARFHFIQSKDNRSNFGPNDDHDKSLDVGVGIVYLIPFGK